MARPEITSTTTKTSARQRRDLSKVPPAAYGVQEFCDAHRISRSKFYELKAKGLGPDEMDVDGRKKISAEAAARWRAEREAATPTNAV